MTTDELRGDLGRLGVTRGQRLFVHASLRAIGFLTEGPEGLVRVLQDLVGAGGLLAMPTFNHGAPFSSSGPGYYDPAFTPSASGLLSDAFFRMPGVVRSLNPTHPIAAWGNGAEALIRDHDTCSTMGPDSPLGRLQRQGGLILHLGTDHQTTSAKHLAECLEDAPCLRSPPDPFPIRLRKGPTVVEERVGFAWRYREKPCPINDGPDALSRAMHGRERVGNVGDARASLCELREFIRAARDQLRAGTVEWPGCSSCSIGPSARREGDWD